MQSTKPFNLADALAGKPVVTRDGRKVTHIHHYPECKQLAALMGDYVTTFHDNGQYYEHQESKADLCMASTTRTGYTVIFGSDLKDISYVFSTKEEANSYVDTYNKYGLYTATVATITWEE